MTFRARKVIFYVLLGLFFLIGASVVLYAQGWRLDFRTLRPEKVGAIFVHSFPPDAAIFLDGQLMENKAGFLSRGTLLSNLFPRTYTLTLSKSGYKDWQESADVAPALVTEFKYAVLVPVAGVPAATSSIKNFTLVSGEPLMETTAGGFLWRGRPVTAGALPDASTELNKFLWRDKKSGAYALYDLGTNSSMPLSIPLSVSAVQIDPYDSARVFSLDARAVRRMDINRATTTVLAGAPAGIVFGKTFAISPSAVAWTQMPARRAASAVPASSAVVLYDKLSQTLTRSSTTVPGETISLKWLTPTLLGVLQADGSLYTYDRDSQIFEKRADEVRFFEPTPDGSALAALESKSLEILPLSDALTYHRFNLPSIGATRGLSWYKDRNHLFVEYLDRIAFLDLDDLGLRNFATVAQGTRPLYNPTQNILYFINSAGKLISFAFP